MTIRTRVLLAALASLTVAQFATAGSYTYASAGKSLNSNWQMDVPAGATVHSVATASCDYMAGPTEYWGATLPDGYWQETDFTTDANGQISVTVTVWTQSTVTFSGTWDTDYVSSSAYAAVGIAGPPAGLVHEARASVSGSSYAVDEKVSTLVGGTYQVYHGGGVSGNGFVSGYTYISWP